MKTKSPGISGDTIHNRITKLFISSEAFTKNCCSSNREILKEVSVLKHQCLHLSLPRSYGTSAEKDEFHKILIEKFAVQAQERIEDQRNLHIPEEKKMRTVDWSITSRTSCRINIWSLHLKIQLMQ